METPYIEDPSRMESTTQKAKRKKKEEEDNLTGYFGLVQHKHLKDNSSAENQIF